MHVLTSCVCQIEEMSFHLSFNCTWLLGYKGQQLGRRFSEVRFSDQFLVFKFLTSKLTW